MTKATAYRLDNYRITVLENVLIKWEQHVALGMERSGKCFIFGDILIIASRSQPDEDGFLIGEFHEQLQKLPVWNKTRYYCFASELLDNVTGQSVTEEFLEQNWSKSRERYAKDISPGAFRLGQYQITVGAERELSWQMYGDLNRIDGGPCLIKSDVLCIGSTEYGNEGQDKQAFLDRLRRLPQWDRTLAWCRGQCLRLCEEPQQTGPPGVISGIRNKWKDRSIGEMTPVRPGEPRTEKRQEKPPEPDYNRYQETAARHLKAGIDRLRRSWHRKRTGKAWLKYLIALAVTGLLLGFALMFHSFEKTFHGHDQHEKHHHEHDDEHDEHR